MYTPRFLPPTQRHLFIYFNHAVDQAVIPKGYAHKGILKREKTILKKQKKHSPRVTAERHEDLEHGQLGTGGRQKAT